ncbi:DUF2637 domain-containing protein [Gordonia bronchialis]|uniref:DUF2637 domain-containing protein n=1 Tax=Gordonia bronchialis TaxID=2054 RepID=UPI001CBF3BB5|nr:DUF2637 domain-containing protein [Gordonia bronchialis]UAK37172.1 DUF2637 domain-containing protein [Gordonia bronchialis]
MNTQPEAHKRGYYGVVLVVGVALSVAGNALHASAVTDGSTLAAVGAAVFPVLLLMMTELTMLTAKRFAGWVRGVTAGLAAVVAVISFAISYEALAYAARELFGIGALLSWLAPLTVDLPIIAATLALWAASDLIRRDRAAVDGVVAPVAIDELSTTTVDDDAQLADGSVDDGLRLPSTAAASGLSTTVDDEGVDTSVDGAVIDGRDLPTAVDGPVVDASAQVSTVVDDALAVVDDDPRPVGEVVDGRQIPLSTVDDGAGHAVVDNADDGFPAVVDDSGRSSTPSLTVGDGSLAVAVVDATRTKVAVDDVARVLALRREGQSMAGIAEAVGIGSHSTVSGLVKAAVRIDPDYAAALAGTTKPALTAVR